MDENQKKAIELLKSIIYMANEGIKSIENGHEVTDNDLIMIQDIDKEVTNIDVCWL